MRFGAAASSSASTLGVQRRRVAARLSGAGVRAPLMKRLAAQFFTTLVIVGMNTAWRDYESSAERTAKRQAELRRRADQRQPRAGR